MTNKNPYEIRLDVLRLAQEMLELEHRTAENVWMTRAGTLGTVPQETEDAFYNYAPKAPSVEDVVAKASTLYNFVSDSSISQNSGRGMLTESRGPSAFAPKTAKGSK